MEESVWYSSMEPGPMLAFLRSTARINRQELTWWLLAMYEVSNNSINGREIVLDATVGILNSLADAWCNTEDDDPGDPDMAMRASLLREIIGNPFRGVQYVGRTIEYQRGPLVLSSGRPAPPIVVADAWLTPLVLDLARAAVANDQILLDQGCLWALADALEESGCADHPIVNHLRTQIIEYQNSDLHYWLCKSDPGALYLTPARAKNYRHTQGCWALRLLLER